MVHVLEPNAPARALQHPKKIFCTVTSISFRGGEFSLKLVDAVGVLITFDGSKLSPEERVRRCRDFASEALPMAEAKSPGDGSRLSASLPSG